MHSFRRVSNDSPETLRKLTFPQNVHTSTFDELRYFMQLMNPWMIQFPKRKTETVYTIKGPALVYYWVSKQYFNQAKIFQECIEILVTRRKIVKSCS